MAFQQPITSNPVTTWQDKSSPEACCLACHPMEPSPVGRQDYRRTAKGPFRYNDNPSHDDRKPLFRWALWKLDARNVFILIRNSTQ